MTLQVNITQEEWDSRCDDEVYMVIIARALAVIELNYHAEPRFKEVDGQKSIQFVKKYFNGTSWVMDENTIVGVDVIG